MALRANSTSAPAERAVAEVLKAGRDSMWGLLLLVIIMGGIYGGIFTPTEAAAVAAVYALLHRRVRLPRHRQFKVPHGSGRGRQVTVMLMFIVANALLFAHVLTTERIPQTIAEQIVAWGMAPWMFLLVVNILLLIAGNFMEPTGIILILAPILFPIATKLGIDPVHLGIIMVVNMEIGMVTPPVGLNLFVTAGITKMSIMGVKAALPWLTVLLVFLVIITYVPELALFLPKCSSRPTRSERCSQFGQVFCQAATSVLSTKLSSARSRPRHARTSGLRRAISSGSAALRSASPGARTRP